MIVDVLNLCLYNLTRTVQADIRHGHGQPRARVAFSGGTRGCLLRAGANQNISFRGCSASTIVYTVVYGMLLFRA